jgi:2-keto-4-pentenoate hydratase/2-oxohepta-3-ene-1,7-dioic acid hydratase in catechol pathway
MKILRFNDDRVGVLKRETVIDISELVSHREYRGAQRVMEELIANFASYKPKIDKLVAAGGGKPLSSVKLEAPLAEPARVMAAFVNYCDQPGRTAETIPLEFFHKCPQLVGPGGTIYLSDIKEVTEFQAEAELAFVIGKEAWKVPESSAMEHVFGYVPFVDVSARGMLRRSQLLGKGQETFSPCGPWITTADEVPDPYKLTVKSWVNGEPRQNYSTGDMAHKIAKQVSWLSRYVRLRPGYVLATGTYHTGLGPVNVGDTFEIEISGLGKTAFKFGGDSPKKAGGHKSFRVEVTNVR